MFEAPARLARASLIALSLIPATTACAQGPVELPIEQPAAAAGASKTSRPGDALAAGSIALSPAPAAAEIEGALKRVFGTSLHLAPPPGSPGFFRGDFNADGSEDLALVTRPAPDALPALNDELAPWIVRDAQRPTPAVVSAADRAGGVQAADILLAIVHGYDTAGWRNPEARHGYLLRHAVADRMRPRPAAEVIQVTEPGARVVGDVLSGTIDGRDGFLYWTGSRYLWRRL